MAGPGGKEVGRVSIRVVPDTENFRKELKAQLEAMEDMEVEIGIDLDTNALAEKVRAAVAAAERAGKITLEVDLDGLERAAAALEAIRDRTIDIRVNDDAVAAAARRAAATVEDQEVELDVDINVDRLRDRLQTLLGRQLGFTRQEKGLADGLARQVRSIDWNALGNDARQRLIAGLGDDLFGNIMGPDAFRFRLSPEEIRRVQEQLGAVSKSLGDQDRALERNRRFQDENRKAVFDSIAALDRYRLAAERAAKGVGSNTEDGDALRRSAARISDDLANARWEAQRTRTAFDDIGESVRRIGDRIRDSIGYQTKQMRQEIKAAKLDEINIRFDAEEGALLAKIAAIKRQLDDLRNVRPIELDLQANKLSAEIDRVTARLERLHSMDVTPEVELEAAQALLELQLLQAQLQRLENERLDINANVDVQDAELTLLMARLEALRFTRHTVTVEVDTDRGLSNLRRFTAAATGAFANINRGFFGMFQRLPLIGRLFRGVTQGFDNMSKASDGFAEGTTSGFKLLQTSVTSVIGGVITAVAMLAVLGVVSYAVAVAGAAITAAWALVSGVIAAAVPAIAALAGPIAVVMIGMDGIKKAAEVLKPAFDTLQKSVENTFQKGLEPVFKRLLPIFPLLTTGANNIAQGIIKAADGLATFARNDGTLQAMESTFFNIRSAIEQVTPGITAMLEAILRVTRMPEAFQPLITVINTLGTEWRKSVAELSAAGPGEISILEQAFTGLASVLGSVTRGMVQLVDNGIRVLAASAPGITIFFDQLTGFFERFDWERLGTAVGNVFTGLGQALQQIPDGTIERITEAFEKLGAVFLQGNVQTAMTLFAEGFALIVSGAASLISALSDVIIFFTNLGAAIGGAATILLGIGRTIVAIVTLIVGAIVNAGTTITDFVATIGSGDWAGFAERTSAAWSGMWEHVTQQFDQAATELETGWQQLSTSFSTPINAPGINFGATTTSVNTFWSEIKPQFSQTPRAAVETAQKEFDKLPAGLKKSFGESPEIARGAMNGVATAAQTSLQPLPQIGATAIQGLNQNLVTGTQNMSTAVTGTLDNVETRFKTFFTNLGTSSQTLSTVVATATTQMTGFSTIITTTLDQISVSFSEKFTTIGQSVGNSFLNISTTVTTQMAAIKTTVDTQMVGISESFRVGFVSAVTGIGVEMAKAKTAVQQPLIEIKALLDQFKADVLLVLPQGFVESVPKIQEAMDQIKEAITQGMADSKAAIDQGIADMKSALEAGVSAFRELGANMGNALADGLESALPRVRAAANALVAEAERAANAAAQVKSPSRVFMRIGGYIGEGFYLGIGKWHKKVRNQGKKLVKVYKDSVKGIPEIFEGALGQNLMGDVLSDTMAVQRAQSRSHSFEYKWVTDEKDYGGHHDLVEALQNCEFRFDRDGIARIVNNSNIRKRRRK